MRIPGAIMDRPPMERLALGQETGGQFAALLVQPSPSNSRADAIGQESSAGQTPAASSSGLPPVGEDRSPVIKPPHEGGTVGQFLAVSPASAPKPVEQIEFGVAERGMGVIPSASAGSRRSTAARVNPVPPQGDQIAPRLSSTQNLRAELSFHAASFCELGLFGTSAPTIATTLRVQCSFSVTPISVEQVDGNIFVEGEMVFQAALAVSPAKSMPAACAGIDREVRSDVTEPLSAAMLGIGSEADTGRVASVKEVEQAEDLPEIVRFVPLCKEDQAGNVPNLAMAFDGANVSLVAAAALAPDQRAAFRQAAARILADHGLALTDMVLDGMSEPANMMGAAHGRRARFR